MFETVIEDYGSDQWQVDEDGCTALDGDHSEIGLQRVALHETGTEISVTPIAEMLHISVNQPIDVNGKTASVAVDETQVTDTQRGEQYIQSIMDEVDEQGITVTGLALVPHSGSLSTITAGESTQDTTGGDELADIIAVDTKSLADGIAVDDLKDVADAIVEHLYGQADAEDLEDAFEIPNEQQAYGELDIHVFTVTEDEIEATQ